MAEPTVDRDPVEFLAAEFVDRLRDGDRPTVEEYALAHPDWAEQIRDLFPTIAAMENLKLDKEVSSGGRASLGPTKIERLGDLRIVREIGRGGMGIVYEAEQESLGRRVAVKVLPKQSLLDDKHLRRFRREAKTAAKLHHTNIVPILGVGEQDGFHYYVMQIIRGAGLDEIIPRLKELSTSGKGDAAPMRY
ncbi:MAG TPA: protein kinase, partial [Pirellulaceae bacterium]|nr:protein kinase [Pirellulaceae bacterium]